MNEHGETFAQQAGIRLKAEPSPLYRLLVLTTLLSWPPPSCAPRPDPYPAHRVCPGD
jgi:hypothetical protein